MDTSTLKQKFFFAAIAAAMIVAGFSCSDEDEYGYENDPLTPKILTQYVDPLIGTGDHGHVFLGANVPFGFVQLGPVNLSQGWDWCSGYHASDSTIMGFAHTHLSGTGIGDLGDILFMPVDGEVRLDRGTPERQRAGFFSLFTHSSEQARPGYYNVWLDRYGINVELTATKHVGFHRYYYLKNADARILIDLEHGTGWDAVVETRIQQENEYEISGYRQSKGWAKDQRVYFNARFSLPIVKSAHETTMEKRRMRLAGDTIETDSLKFEYLKVFFNVKESQELLVKVALSSVSIDNAKANMEAELPGWNFGKTAKAATKAWERELNKIDFMGYDGATVRKFYTALYHTMIAPSEFCDANGDYFGTDKEIHRKVKFRNYTTFSLWDTYRAAHPLMTIIHPEKMPDIINTMLAIYKEQGKLPVWHLMGNETDCMVGNPGVCVVADAILKGVKGFDRELAYEAMRTSVMLDDRGQDFMRQYGYIPYDKANEAVAKTMEYAIAYWSVAQVAKVLGKEDDYKYFQGLSEGYKHFFDPQTGFMRGKDSEGNFRPDFDPFHSVHGQSDYTEGTAWQYIWLAPHDVEGLAGLFPTRASFVSKLDSLFVVSGEMGENASPDISGLIGQYAHGNEPSHHILYLYSCIGEPAKTAEKVRYVLENLYTDKPAGLCGNEDVGQMSAWFVLSALGFYQVEPAGGRYYIGSPATKDATIRVGKNKTFKIKAPNNSPTNIYVKSIKLNGEIYNKTY
ncbi:MAG: GH92 family glycosyl hydrolase, partial [Tannerella sp.]|nr:GH92 family glycosyl hydrolase [Tannerella sp.]